MGRDGHGEEGVEDPANPDVLVQDDGGSPGIGGCGPKDVGALASVEGQVRLSQGPFRKRRRTLSQCLAH